MSARQAFWKQKEREVIETDEECPHGRSYRSCRLCDPEWTDGTFTSEAEWDRLATAQQEPPEEPDDRPIYVNVYRLDRRYGGPEEGGWYYDTGEPLAAIPADDDAHAERLRAEYEAKYEDHGQRYSVAPRERDYKVVIERHWPDAWPRQTPRYE